MSRFHLYLSKSFLTIWLSVVFAFLVLIGLLDSLANGGDIVGEGGNFLDTFKYMFYRAPVIFDRIFVFTLMVATLLTYVRLIRNHELVALLGFGFSVPKQFMTLAPVMLFCSLVSITIINYAMPPAVRALQAWGIGEYKVKALSDKNPLWIQDGLDVVVVRGRPGMNELSKLEIWKRNEKGEVQEVIWSDWAVFDGNGGWVLKKDVKRLEIAGLEGDLRKAEPAQNLRWDTKQTPETIARLAAEPRDLGLSDLKNFSQKGNSGSKPRFAFDYWYWHRLTRPFAALFLLLCAIPIMQRTGRQDNGDKALLVGIAVGFIFLVIDAAMATLSTSGGLSVGWGIAFPLILLAFFGSFLILRTESLGRKRPDKDRPEDNRPKESRSAS